MRAGNGARHIVHERIEFNDQQFDVLVKLIDTQVAKRKCDHRAIGKRRAGNCARRQRERGNDSVHGGLVARNDKARAECGRSALSGSGTHENRLRGLVIQKAHARGQVVADFGAGINAFGYAHDKAVPHNFADGNRWKRRAAGRGFRSCGDNFFGRSTKDGNAATARIVIIACRRGAVAAAAVAFARCGVVW